MLLIDDEGYHRDRLGRELEALGCAIATESTPGGALESLRENAPDWVCVEPFLPNGSWFRFLHSLAAYAALRRWLVVTAFPSSSLAVEAMKLGAADVLTKPVSGPQLIEAFRGGRGQEAPRHETDLSLARLEWEHLNNVLRLCGGNVSEAARRLGIPRQTLYNKLRKVPRVQSSARQTF